MDAIEILKKACEKTSQGKVANELGISKTSVNLLLKQSYPNPQNMYKKIKEFYAGSWDMEIIGVETNTTNLSDLLKEIEC
jgi:predicted transcriptional regulator